MANMSLEKIKMPEQAPDVRNKNFKEVSLGYTEEMAIEEAQRCLNCKHKPCVSGCPVNVRIPEFIAEVAKGNFMAAYKVITSTNALPAVCGRVCPQESQCESKCVRGMKGEAVGIGRLERFVADWYMKNCDEMPEKPASNGKKVAVIGSGPSALACAGDLAKQGYAVTMFEAFHKAGGVLVYGIPEFRLPKAIVQKEIDKLTALGVKIMTNICPNMIPPSATARQSLLSAAVTLPWMRQDAQSVWVRSMFISYTAVPKRKCPPVWKRCITQKRKALNSTCSKTPYRFLMTATVRFAALNA